MRIVIQDRIIVALDVSTLDEARQLVEQLLPYINCFKVGSQFLKSIGSPRVVDFIHALGGNVFFDDKLIDIPNTVAGAARAISELGVEMFNVMACSGIEAMRAAVENKGDSLVLAVTVLTSLSQEDTRHIFGASTEAKVLQFALDAESAGVDGIICSPQDLGILRTEEKLAGLLRVTPGVRPEWADIGDQQRVMTPPEAIKAGADMLVIGRPITKPPEEIGSPVDAVQMILDDIDETC